MPRVRRRILLFSVLLALLLNGLIGAQAQDNLLKDPGFENPSYKNAGTGDAGGSFNVPADWNGWFAQSPRTQEWMNLIPNGYPHTAQSKRSGERSLSIGRGSATFTVAVYQTVPVTSGSNVRGTVWAFMENITEAGGQVRIGIDPSGGTNPLSAGIVWSGFYSTVQSWIQLSVDATATADNVTLFVYATQKWPNDPNNLFLDDAALVIGGGGGTAPNQDVSGGTPAPPPPTNPPPVVPFVSAQGAQPDGSIVHTVQPGDTIDSIAVAYGVTRNEILQLNNLSSPRILQIGQKLTIKLAPTSEAPAVEPTSAPNDSAPDDNVPTVVIDGAVVGDENVTQVAAQPTEQPATEVPQPVFTPTEAPPAPVAAASSDQIDPAETFAVVCVFFFEDTNANRIQEGGEALLPGGSITLSMGGSSVGTYETDGVSEPYCFGDLAAGDYVAAGTAPAGYGLTTPDQLRLRLQPGTRLDVAFGAAVGVQPVIPPPADSSTTELVSEEPEPESSTSQLMQISGLIVFGLAGIVLVGGLGMTLLLRRR